ncbi:tetratricopeptide repeat protein [Streptomyces lincolnensis]|uniref:tetratricopeptide repeat protein n=1 Tax=Streptomyces lincolnensis TaxID=1915 RepID=UPI0008347773|nr:tetratricopeptide repeat protein [Streptomyces lincolnensis]QMV04973.1 tetratricopeptide repeat protein [Streptomyces lincolnensis]
MTGTGRDHSFQEIRPVRALQTPAFELAEVTVPSGFAEHDRRLEELAQAAAAQVASRTELLLAPLTDSLVEMSLDLGNGFEDLLEDARANVGEEKYGLARELLEEYLEQYPDHHEARYLRAYCMFHLDDEEHEEALRILRPLRDEQLEPGLRDRVGQLRRELRRRLTPGEITAYATVVKANPRRAFARLETFLELAPEEGTLSYLLALGQARDGDLDKALATAERGAAEADGDREQVAALARRLRLALLAPAVRPVVEALKQGALYQARSMLAGVEPGRPRAVVLEDLDAFIGLLIVRPHETPVPQLPSERLNDLYALIAEPDTQQAMLLMNTGRVEQAENLLARQLALVPGFPWLNFAYALCLLRIGRHPDRAAACAEIAQRDPTITQGRELLTAIRGWQEALVINPVVEEYVKAMETVRGGASVNALSLLGTRLGLLQRRLPELRRAARTEAGTQVVEELGKAIGDRLTEIDEATVVGALFEKYERVMSTVQGGIRTDQEATGLAASLDALTKEIRTAGKRSGQTTSVRRQLDELANVVSARRSEVDRVTASLKVSALVQRFNRLAEEQTSSYSRSTRPDPYRVRAELTGILQQATALRNGGRKTLEERDRKLLDDLIGAISGTLR